MAKAVSNIAQKGTFKHKNKEYSVEINKKKSSEIYNFYDDENTLMCSFFIKYSSKIVGVKQSGDYDIEIYGNAGVYYTFIDKIKQIRDNKNRGMETGKNIFNDELGLFIKVIEDSKPGEYYYKIAISEGIILQETLEIYDKQGQVETYINYNVEETGKTVTVKKIKGVKYQKKEKKESFIRPPETNDLMGISILTGKDFSFLKYKNYRVLLKEEELDEYIIKIKENNDIVGFDTETTGLSINRIHVGHPKRDRLAGICLSTEDDEGVYIPVGHKFIPNLDEETVINKLRPFICKTGINKKSLVTHYGSFDWKVMYTYGIKLNIVHDTYILYYMLNNSAFRTRKDLTDMAKKELEVDMIELNDIFKKVGRRKPRIDFSLLQLDDIINYAPADADITRLIFKKLYPELPKSMIFLYGIEIELMKYLAKIEYYGIRIDIDKLIKIKAESEKELDEIENKIYDFVGRQFKISSPKELSKILYEELKYPVLARTQKNEPSTGKLALKQLSEEKDKKGESKYPLANLLKKYRETKKLLDGFINKMLDENIDGFIFPKYNQTGTDSGRISCSGPNLQQSPGSHREVFITDSDDYYFIVVDYSQIEYRVMAGLADEIDIIESFEDPETDHHIRMYSLMFGKEQDLVNDSERKLGKMLNFGVTYGMGDRSLAITVFNSAEDSKAKEAGELKEKYFESVPYIKDMLSKAGDLAFAQGYIATKFGRRRYFPDVRSEEEYIRISNRRKAANTKVQGTAADILKIAHVRVEKKIEELGLDVNVKLSMHDELALQVNKNISPWYILDILRDRMELKIKGFPPLFIGSNVGSTWAVGKRDDLEIPIRLIERKVKDSEETGKYDVYEDPETSVAIEIKNYMSERIEEIVKEKKLTKEEIKEYPKITKIIKDYFGLEHLENIVDYIDKKIKDEKIKEEDNVIYMKTGANYNTEENYFDEIDGGEEGEEEEYIDERAIERLHVEDKDRLVIETPEIKSAKDYYIDNSKVIVSDRKCYIKLDGITKSSLRELKEYLKVNGSDNKKWNKVMLIKGNKIIKTKFHLYKVDKIKISMILEGITEKRLNA